MPIIRSNPVQNDLYKNDLFNLACVLSYLTRLIPRMIRLIS